MECKFVLFTNRKSHTSFRSVVGTEIDYIDELEQRKGRYFALLHWRRLAFIRKLRQTGWS